MDFMFAIHVWELSPRPRPFRKNYVDNNHRGSSRCEACGTDRSGQRARQPLITKQLIISYLDQLTLIV